MTTQSWLPYRTGNTDIISILNYVYQRGKNSIYGKKINIKACKDHGNLSIYQQSNWNTQMLHKYHLKLKKTVDRYWRVSLLIVDKINNPDQRYKSITTLNCLPLKVIKLSVNKQVSKLNPASSVYKEWTDVIINIEIQKP